MSSLSSTQKLLAAFLPRRSMEAMEAESRLWMVRCSCGHARSIWELGGIRYGAAGQPHRFMRCPQCGRLSWHTVSREQPPSAPSDKT